MLPISTIGNFKSSTFTTKSGKGVETKPHFASFDDKHNASKCKVLIVLYHRKHKLQDASGIGVNELHRASGVSYDYIKARVTKWVQWGYMERSVRDVKTGRPIYVYKLAARGKHFIEDILPREWLKTYIAGIKSSSMNV